MIEIKHRITGNVLFSARCASLKLCVEAAVKACADLADADLADADLERANLAGADLARAYLAGINDVDQLGQPDSWPAFCWHRGAEVMVQVGCKSFTISEGREYWAGKDNRREVLAALDYAEKIAQIRGWK